MTRMVLKSRVGADGVLQLNIPVGAGEANREVQVTIESEPTPMSAVGGKDGRKHCRSDLLSARTR
jgi:hypothetical protein